MCQAGEEKRGSSGNTATCLGMLVSYTLLHVYNTMKRTQKRWWLHILKPLTGYLFPSKTNAWFCGCNKQNKQLIMTTETRENGFIRRSVVIMMLSGLERSLRWAMCSGSVPIIVNCSPRVSTHWHKAWHRNRGETHGQIDRQTLRQTSCLDPQIDATIKSGLFIFISLTFGLHPLHMYGDKLLLALGLVNKFNAGVHAVWRVWEPCRQRT